MRRFGSKFHALDSCQENIFFGIVGIVLFGRMGVERLNPLLKYLFALIPMR
jgi:hypothetical protein